LELARINFANSFSGFCVGWIVFSGIDQKGTEISFQIFEEYVGLILKDAYGENEVRPEIPYKKGKFIDWYVEKDDKVYLFEVKAKQFSLTILQTGNIELIQKEVKEKIFKAVKQVYDRISEINSYEELKQFRGKKIIPIIIFLDIPFVSSDGYKKIINKDLTALEAEEKYKDISPYACV